MFRGIVVSLPFATLLGLAPPALCLCPCLWPLWRLQPRRCSHGGGSRRRRHRGRCCCCLCLSASAAARYCKPYPVPVAGPFILATAPPPLRPGPRPHAHATHSHIVASLLPPCFPASLPASGLSSHALGSCPPPLPSPSLPVRAWQPSQPAASKTRRTHTSHQPPASSHQDKTHTHPVRLGGPSLLRSTSTAHSKCQHPSHQPGPAAAATGPTPPPLDKPPPCSVPALRASVRRRSRPQATPPPSPPCPGTSAARPLSALVCPACPALPCPHAQDVPGSQPTSQPASTPAAHPTPRRLALLYPVRRKRLPGGGEQALAGLGGPLWPVTYWPARLAAQLIRTRRRRRPRRRRRCGAAPRRRAPLTVRATV